MAYNPYPEPGQGVFDPGVAPTTHDLTSLAGQGPGVLAQMNPEERDAYLRAQQQNPANAGEAWSGSGAYDAYATPLKAQFAGDPYFTQRVTGGIQGAQQVATNGWNGAADINAYQLGGDPAYAANEAARLRGTGAAMAGRTGPTIDTASVSPWQGAQTSAGNGQMQAGAALAGLAQNGGAGTGLTGQAGAGLMGLARAPAGPSAAELAMKATAEQGQRNQASMAAGVRGGNSALALQNAAANSAQMGGTLSQQIGVQRAAEDVTNRTLQANAFQAAGSIYGSQEQQRLAAAEAAGGAYGGAGQTFGQGASLNAGVATNNAALEGQQRGRNDQAGQFYESAQRQVTADQSNLNTAYDKQRTADYIAARNGYSNPDNTGRGTITGSAGGDKVLGAGIAAAGAIAAPFTGGASLAAVPAGAGIAQSDIRAKTDIAPAGHAIDQTFRGLGDYGYEYKDPRAAGAAPGQHFGPMAQELEQTPAGASTVTRTPGGMKGIDTGRLALVNASETARLRKELDALKVSYGVAPAMYDPESGIEQANKDAYDIKDTQTVYPDTGYKDPRFAAIDRQAELKRRARIETPLEFDPAGGGTFRSPLEQARFSAMARHPGGYGSPAGPDMVRDYAYASRGP